MINEKRSELLQNTLLAEIAKKINARKGEDAKIAPTEDEVFTNLTEVYDEIPEMEFGQPTGKVTKYMPKVYKEMIMRLIAPNFAFSYRTNYGEYAVTVEAFLFLSYGETQPVTQGKATIPYSAAPDSEGTEYQRKAYCESMARGLAESKAYQKYGIGCWFNQQIEPDDDPEKAVQKAKAEEGMNPEIATIPTTTAPTPTPVSNEASEPTIPKTNVETSTPDPEPVNKKKNITVNDPAEEINEDSVPTSSNEEMPLDKALSLPCEIGKAATQGLTLGETAEKYPANLVWQYVQPNISQDSKTAIKVIVKANPELAQLFAEKNIVL